MKEQFKVNGAWKWFQGTVFCIRRSGNVIIQFDDGTKYQYTAKQASLLPRVERCGAPQRPKKKRKKKVFWTYKPVNDNTEEDKDQQDFEPVTKRIKTSYNTEAKTDSLNKIMCRQAMVSELGPKHPKLKALVLDAEDTKFSEVLVINHGVQSTNIDVPNCNGADVVEEMNARGFATVHDSFLGDFLRSPASQKTKQYDLLFLDYCGMPGDAGKPNTPIHDMAELFEGRFVAKRATLGVTVCLRNHAKTAIMYQNMHKIANAVTSAAFTNGYLATTKMQTIYKDQGSQTMCFVCFYITKL